MASLLTVNGGSSSIKFARFETTPQLQRILSGRLEGVGLAQGTFAVRGPTAAETFSRTITAQDHHAAVQLLMDWVEERIAHGDLRAVGHRVVHGGPRYSEAQRITPEMVKELHELKPLDPEHLPEEILLTEAFEERFPSLPQVACFDTAFHRTMPRVARLLPIPRRYDAVGVQRYGFHGLSCAYLIEELERIAGTAAARGRVVLAHLGNGASITAVRHGCSVDTSMGLTPAAGIPMSSRSGDLDPGVAYYLARTEGITGHQFHEMVNHQSGLLGVSEISSDIRELLAHEAKDIRAREALELFCYQTKKWICAMAGALGGLDTLVFSGGIGENATVIRERICEGLEFLGIRLHAKSNAASHGVISDESSPVTVRVMRTDEEWIIARTVCQVLGWTEGKDNHEPKCQPS